MHQKAYTLYLFVQDSLLGGLTLERGMGMCRSHDPLFSGQSPLPSLPIYRQMHCSCDPRFQFLENVWIFSHVLAKILALSLDPNFSKFSLPKTPIFSRKIRSLDPTFWNLHGTLHQKKLSAPPPPPRILYTVVSSHKLQLNHIIISCHVIIVYEILVLTQGACPNHRPWI